MVAENVSGNVVGKGEDVVGASDYTPPNLRRKQNRLASLFTSNSKTRLKIAL